MNVESVFIDIDGTLMDSHGHITSDSIRLIKKLINNNVKVVINSGRILSEIKTVLRKMDIVLPVIGCNGGFITDDKCDGFKVLNLIPKHALTECMEICRKQKAIKCYSTAQHFYTDVNFKPFMEMSRVKHVELVKGNLMAEPVYVKENEWQDLFKNKGYIKFNAYAENPELQPQLEAALSEASGISLSFKSPQFLEYSACGINKGYSMLSYLHMHGLSQNTSVAIGDGDNDIQMIEAAGIGIAMGNAEDSLKKQADFVAGRIDENGLSQVLEKLMD